MSLFQQSHEDYFYHQEWNQKMIQNSAKMIRLLLVLLGIWTIFTLGWIVHLIILKSHHKPPDAWYTLNKRSTEDQNTRSYMDLNFYTFVNGTSNESDWNRIKMIIGGFHKLKEGPGKVPKITFYVNDSLDELKAKESSAWNKVEFKSTDFKSMILDHNKNFKNVNETGSIWISSDYAFDPVALELRKAELLDEVNEFEKVFKKGRNIIEKLANGCIDLIDDATGAIILESYCEERAVKHAKEYGLHKISRVSKAHLCHVDLKEESIENGAELVDYHDIETLKNIESSHKKKLAIGVPTTSKGMNNFKETHVMLQALIPSLKKTVSIKELKEFKIALFIGFDEGDEYFESSHADLRKEIYKIIPQKDVSIIFLRLLPLKRVAMTWNMIFHLARRHVQFDYFYQVNDDLTMKTPGWLTKFTESLEKTGGIGVAGPSDSFNGFSCSLLTQSFVTWRHFEIFRGNYYPLVFRDWKSDRWLSFVYGPARTFCWQQIEATNGAKGTRYKACPFPEWKMYLQ